MRPHRRPPLPAPCRTALVCLALFACRNEPPRTDGDLTLVSRALDTGLVAITKKWNAAGGEPVLGAATSGVLTIPNGAAQYQTFARDRVIVDSVDFGSVLLTRDIFDKWLALQGQTTANGDDLFTFVGLPRADFSQVAHYEASFAGATFVQESGSPVFVVYGEMNLAYSDRNTKAMLGAPTGDETGSLTTGRSQGFRGGELHWWPGVGAKVLKSSILRRWQAEGGATGRLGPVLIGQDYINVIPGGWVGESASFLNGFILTRGFTGNSSDTFVFMNDSPVTQKYVAAGGATGALGLPTSEERIRPATDDTFVDFQYGVIVHRTYEPGAGTHVFERLDFFWEGIEGSGDLYGKGRLTTSQGYGAGFTRPVNPCQDGCAIGMPDPLWHSYPQVVFANSDLSIDVQIEGWDDEGLLPDRPLGLVKATYDMDNLWGLYRSPRHSNGTFAVTMSVRNYQTFDRSDRLGKMWWGAENFSTPLLSYNQFADTFTDVDRDESVWFHPFNHLFYNHIYKTASANGNCFGMVVESIYVDVNRSPHVQPLVRQDPLPSDARNRFNIKHGYQLGQDVMLWMAAQFTGGKTHDPRYVFEQSRQLRYPMIAVYDDAAFGNGHVLRPYEWSRGHCARFGRECDRILVFDPNFPAGQTAGERAIEIDGDRFHYDGGETSDGRKKIYSGHKWLGGRLVYLPASLVAGQPKTLIDTALSLLRGNLLVTLGSGGRTTQITDDAGRTFFEPGLAGVPTRWDQIRQDPTTRIPNLSPLPLTNEAVSPVQMYLTTVPGGTQTYDMVLAPGQPAGTLVEATFESGTLSSHFAIPGTPDKPDRITAEKISTADKALAVAIAADGTAKPITWTLAGAQKHRWVELSDLNLAPSQKLKARVLGAGTALALENTGPATMASVRINPGPGATPIALGMKEIPSGNSTLEVRDPVTTLTLGGKLPGANGWLLGPVTVTLSSQDLSGKGLQGIEYSRDGATTWTGYTGPFTLGDEGTNVLLYRARDLAFNVESARSQSIKIDSRPPSATGTVSTTGAVRLSYSVTDPTPGSGPAGVRTRVQGPTGPIDGFAAGATGTVALPTTCSAVEFWGEDVAGNQQTSHVVRADSVKPRFTVAPAAVESSHCTVSGGLVIATPTATDDCGGAVRIEHDMPAKFPLGTTIVTWRAIDTAGNAETATQKVTVVLDDDASCCPAGSRVIRGTSGHDTIIGTASNECILGLGGNDTIEGRGGFDFIAGGPGDDNITGGSVRDYIWGGSGRDVIDAREGDDFIDGGVGGIDSDSCSGGTGTNATLRCETRANCNAACCSTSVCSMPPPGPLGCQTPYAQSSCGSYVTGRFVSRNGSNWECTNGNCANCATFASCAPGATGCPWGVVWTNRGSCP